MATPIEHVVVLMLENRSFDHVFGFRPGVKGLTGNEFNLLDPTKPESGSNPRFTVDDQAPFAVADREGPSHSLNGVNVQLFDDKAGPAPGQNPSNTGFVRNYRDHLLQGRHNVPRAEIQEVVQSFTREKLPSIFALADAFCLCDNWFCEVPGPTMPNRFYIHAATSVGFVHNVFKKSFFQTRTIYHQLQDKGRTWATYFHDLSEVLQFFPPEQRREENFRRFDTSFAEDITGDRLPNYSFILPRFLNDGPDRLANSQHAPEDVRHGDRLLADVYKALRSNLEVWNKSVLIVTYDEHGGFYDHVPPPSQDVRNPDGIDSPPPDDPATFPVPHFDFRRLGLRVPTVIASPRVPKGKVDSTLYQHTSVLATVQKLFGLDGPLTQRDAQARSFEALFLETPRTDTPAELPVAAAPAEGLAVAAEIPVEAGEEPLTTLQQEMLEGFIAMTRGLAPPAEADVIPGGRAAAARAPLPSTQREAADLVQRELANLFQP